MNLKELSKAIEQSDIDAEAKAELLEILEDYEYRCKQMKQQSKNALTQEQKDLIEELFTQNWLIDKLEQSSFSEDVPKIHRIVDKLTHARKELGQ